MGRTRSIFETYCPTSVPVTLYSKQIKHNKHLKSESPKSQLEVLDFFKQHKYPLEEAFKFYAHYKARGWKLGGNTLMEDWKAAADSWVIRSRDYQIKCGSVNHSAIQPDHLLISKVKNYGEPL
jgi:hypothetical protein